MTLHVNVTDEDNATLDELATLTGRKKANLAALAIGLFVRRPTIREATKVEDGELRSYLLDTPAALELVALGMAAKVPTRAWRVLIEHMKEAVGQR